jgi:hypothetical protein
MGKLIHGYNRRGKRSPEYQAYMDAKDRCTNPNNPDYILYAGRGVRFLFRNFLDFIALLGPRPSNLHSLDRVDPDGPYAATYKGHTQVRWATRSEQIKNRRCMTKPNQARAKITEIRSKYESGVTQLELAAQFHVSDSLISKLLQQAAA